MGLKVGIRKAKLTVGKARAFAWFNSTKTAATIWASLPLKGTAYSWGKELYFEVPVKIGEEKARQVVDFGDLAYWPEGNCLCVFFGPTPVSRADEIRAASPVNVLGRIMNDPMVFQDISEAEAVIEKVEKGIERIAVGTDESSPLVDAVAQYLDDRDIRYRLYDPAPWPEVAEEVGRSVASGESDEGMLFCWTGTGVSLAANKIPGVRAALCYNAAMATESRQWNHANILVMGLHYTAPELARQILDAWFSAPFDEDEVANVVRVAEIEHRNLY